MMIYRLIEGFSQLQLSKTPRSWMLITVLVCFLYFNESRCAYLSTKEPIIKVYSFGDSVFDFFLEKESESIIVNVANDIVYLNEKLEKIDLSFYQRNHFAKCKSLYDRCTQESAFNQSNYLEFSTGQKYINDCGKFSCAFFGPEKSWLYNISASSTIFSHCTPKGNYQFSYALESQHKTNKLEHKQNNVKRGSSQTVSGKTKFLANRLDWKLHSLFQNENNPDDSLLYFTSNNINISFTYGFAHGSWVYIVYLKSGIGKRTESKILRFCGNQVGGFSYNELAMVCEAEDKGVYNFATSAYFSKKSDIQKTKNTEGEDNILYVNFKRSGAQDGSNFEDDSVLCSFPVAQIDTWLEVVTMNQEDCGSTYQKSEGCVKGHLDPLRGELMAKYPEEGTSLAVTFQNNQVVAFVGTSQGNLLKFHLLRNSESSLHYNISLLTYADKNASSLGIRKNYFLDKDEQNLYLLLDNTVMKFPVGSCFPYQNPKSCIKSSLPCGWCQTKCTLQEDCNDTFVNDWMEYTGPMSVVLLAPITGPSNGGTTLELQVHFSEVEVIDHEEQVEFQIGNVTCTTQNWIERIPNNSWSVECVTGELNADYEGPVVLSIQDGFENKVIARATSETLFSYLEPTLYGIWPGFGPRAGGTIVTLYGNNLNIGRNRKVTLSGLNCEIIKLESNFIKCKTSRFEKSSEHVSHGFVTLWIDGNPIKPKFLKKEKYSGIFEYRMDPVVTSVNPHSTIASGGTSLTVFGRNLDSVATLQLLVIQTMNGVEHKSFQNCTLIGSSGVTLSCPTPPLDFELLGEKATDQMPFRTEVAFAFDGLPKERTYSYNTDRKMYLYYYNDPVLDRFQRVLTEEDITPEFEFQGSNLNTTLKKTDIKVFSNGADFCDVTSITFYTLYCKLFESSLRQLENRNTSRYYFIKATIGNLEFSLGKIFISAQDQPEKTESSKFTNEHFPRDATLQYNTKTFYVILLCVLAATVCVIYIFRKHLIVSIFTGDNSSLKHGGPVNQDEDREAHGSAAHHALIEKNVNLTKEESPNQDLAFVNAETRLRKLVQFFISFKNILWSLGKNFRRNNMSSNGKRMENKSSPITESTPSLSTKDQHTVSVVLTPSL